MKFGAPSSFSHSDDDDDDHHHLLDHLIQLLAQLIVLIASKPCKWSLIM